MTEGSPNVVDLILAREISLVINTPAGRGARVDGYEIRAAAIAHGIPCITTMAGASAAADWSSPAIAVSRIAGERAVRKGQALQDRLLRSVAGDARVAMATARLNCTSHSTDR